jgi:hypothetical protein
VPNAAGIAGPTGATGATGPTGVAGAKVWFVAGSGPPSGSFGADGDICFFIMNGDTVTDLYQRTSTGWDLKATKFTPP